MAVSRASDTERKAQLGDYCATVRKRYMYLQLEERSSVEVACSRLCDMILTSRFGQLLPENADLCAALINRGKVHLLTP